ncbi:UNKNOWN [Stylonychia lemnae]|uniref:Uncharacterized protein n=1 Tax=Stylonychia lemnae TaxID=5949 RepID=A0A078A9Z4_STYLE|nr:UNKNOWN [Stylonychia lemnae]|eukprot:CDW78716.1 UNKNOWN [Stylonychia lemnae]
MTEKPKSKQESAEVICNLENIQDCYIEQKYLIEGQQRELQEVRLENEKLREKIQELEKWIVLLLNNFYSGNPQNLDAIKNGFEVIDEMRNQIFLMKKTILFDRKKYQDLQEDYMNQKKKMKEREEDMKKMDVGELILQRQALEENLRYLSEEVEALSQKNQRLLKDLKVKDFYQSYNQISDELKRAHSILISTLQPDGKLPKKSIRDQKSPLSNPNDQAYISQSNQISYRTPSAHHHTQSQNDSKLDSLFSFISCQGCGVGDKGNAGVNYNSNFAINQPLFFDNARSSYYNGDRNLNKGNLELRNFDDSSQQSINFLLQKSPANQSRSRGKNSTHIQLQNSMNKQQHL